MTNNVQINESVEFEIVTLAIVTKGGKKIDVKNIFQELNIYDSIFMSAISGNIILSDAIGIIKNLLFDGSEVLLVEIGKDRDSILFKKSFRIYKLSDRKNANQKAEIFVLNFVSDEFIHSSQIKVNQSFTDFTNSEVAASILKRYLNIDALNTSSSIGIKKIVIPNLPPLEAIEWLAKRTVDINSSPNFLFFENKLGFNFMSLSDIIDVPEIAKINYTIKNLKDEAVGEEFLGVRDVKVLSQFNFLDNTKSGVYAGSFIGFDPITRTYATKNVSFLDHYNKNKHLSDLPNVPVVTNEENKTNVDMYNARKTLYMFDTFRTNSEYVKKNDPNSIINNDNSFDYVLERKSIFKNFLNKRLRIVLPGNFNISSGFNVFLNSPDRTNFDGNNKDETLYGKYTIISTRHIINFRKHEVVFDVASDGTSQRYLTSSSVRQNEELENYG